MLILSYANQFSSTRNVNQFPCESKLFCIRSKARSIVTFYFPCSIFFLYTKVPVSFHASFLGNDRGGVFRTFPMLSLQLLSISRRLESIFDVRVIISIMILNIIIVMAVKTSGCSDILYNDWAASRSQSMQGSKSLQLKS